MIGLMCVVAWLIGAALVWLVVYGGNYHADQADADSAEAQDI